MSYYITLHYPSSRASGNGAPCACPWTLTSGGMGGVRHGPQVGRASISQTPVSIRKGLQLQEPGAAAAAQDMGSPAGVEATGGLAVAEAAAATAAGELWWETCFQFTPWFWYFRMTCPICTVILMLSDDLSNLHHDSDVFGWPQPTSRPPRRGSCGGRSGSTTGSSGGRRPLSLSLYIYIYMYIHNMIRCILYTLCNIMLHIVLYIVPLIHNV